MPLSASGLDKRCRTIVCKTLIMVGISERAVNQSWGAALAVSDKLTGLAVTLVDQIRRLAWESVCFHSWSAPVVDARCAYARTD
jgi:hypothetical protein